MGIMPYYFLEKVNGKQVAEERQGMGELISVIVPIYNGAEHLDSFFGALLPQYAVHIPSDLPIQHFPPIFRDKYYMVNAVPFRVC
jgi:hypothetical protein